jgi:hypothetical protein
LLNSWWDNSTLYHYQSLDKDGYELTDQSGRVSGSECIKAMEARMNEAFDVASKETASKRHAWVKVQTPFPWFKSFRLQLGQRRYGFNDLLSSMRQKGILKAVIFISVPEWGDFSEGQQ